VAANASKVQSAAEVHAQLRAHPEIQFDLPPAQPPPPPPRWLTDLIESLFGAMSLPSWVLYGLLIAVGLLLVFLVARWGIGAYGQREGQAAPVDEVAAWRPEEKVARALLAEAEAMAAAGRYEEAVRLLLHRSLEDIQRRRPKLLRPALTSREIARVPLLPEAVRGAFEGMAAPVETSLFGGRRLDRSAWESAREAYRSFALPEAWA
jgi:hypothetical protein